MYDYFRSFRLFDGFVQMAPAALCSWISLGRHSGKQFVDIDIRLWSELAPATERYRPCRDHCHDRKLFNAEDEKKSGIVVYDYDRFALVA